MKKIKEINTFQKGNEDTILEQLDAYFHLLNDLNDPIKINESQQAYMSIKYMRSQLAKQPSNVKIKIIELIIKSKVHIILSNLFSTGRCRSKKHEDFVQLLLRYL